MPDGTVKIRDAGGKLRVLGCNDSKQRVVVRLNCGDGAEHQHYDRCTPKALKGHRDLLCPFHFGNRPEWYSSNRRPIPQAELRWMKVVQKTAGGEDWCHQVRSSFHRGDFDFYNWRRDTYLQIDEARHWKGMTATCNTKQSDQDFACNLAAYKAGAAVVRVHTADIVDPISVYAAMEAARFHSSVVLTASYASVWWCQDDKRLCYADRLLQHFGEGCKTITDCYGNRVFLRADAPTM